MPAIKIAAFYKFAPLMGLEDLQNALLKLCAEQEILGTILIGDEGINGTVGGPAAGVDTLIKYLKSRPELSDLAPKYSENDGLPFRRMKVRIKPEIVTLGVPGVAPAKMTGAHISAKNWNEVISDPETIVIDTRNRYETKIGSFKGAIDPKIDNFRDFPKFIEDNLDPKKHTKVAMFCTGGIRCEKASAYMLQKGFKDVVQLNGGILKYVEEMPEDESLWDGDCFVFDYRVGVNPELEAAGYEMCPSCRWPLTTEEKGHPDYEEGVSCQNCRGSLTEAKLASSRERHKQIQLAEKRGTKHLG